MKRQTTNISGEATGDASDEDFTAGANSEFPKGTRVMIVDMVA